jgi:hypothetical protein
MKARERAKNIGHAPAVPTKTSRTMSATAEKLATKSQKAQGLNHAGRVKPWTSQAENQTA